MSHKITPDEERALDALLAELHGQPAPDLSQQILARWRAEASPREADATPCDAACHQRSDRVHVRVESTRHISTRHGSMPEKNETRSLWRLAIGIVAIAAAALGLIWLGRDLDAPPADPPVAARSSRPAGTSSPAEPAIQPAAAARETQLARDTPDLPPHDPLWSESSPAERPEPKPLKGIPLAMDAAVAPPSRAELTPFPETVDVNPPL
ncbi:MAG: hypothetical protein ACF788_00885, partial [Novipirellula sp. JB048]